MHSILNTFPELFAAFPDVDYWHCPHSVRNRFCVTFRCPSVRPSVCPVIRRRSGVLRVCCWAPCGREISINSGGCRAPSSNGATAHRSAAAASGGFKEWPTTPLPYGPRRPLTKIDKKFALQLPKQDFYSFRLCTVDKVHAVRSVDNNSDMPFPSQKFNAVNVWVAAKRIGIVLIKTHFVALRIRLNPPPGDAHGFLK